MDDDLLVPDLGNRRWRRSRWTQVPWDAVDVAIVVLAGFLAAITAAALIQALAGSALPALGLTGSAATTAAALLEEAAFYVAWMAVLLVVLHRRHHLGLGALGWRRPHWYWIPAAVVIALAGQKGVEVVASWIVSLFPGQENPQVHAVQQSYGHLLVLAIPAVSLIAPVAEETLFRGFVYGWMRRHMNVPLSAILSGAFFAAAHFTPIIFPPLLILGVVLALLYEYSGSLLPGAIVHGVFNLIEIIQILS